jgi:DUF4097 and DUF4098 domain-containing protein YvlB
MKKQARFLIAAILVAVPMLLAFRGYVEDDSRSKTFTVGKGGTLEVSVDGGDVKINVWDRNEVLVKVDGIDDEDLDRLKMKQSGNDVRVEFRNRRSWGGWNSNHLRFEITIPKQYNADLHTSGGDISVRGTVDGKITGSTSGGDVKLEDVRGGRVELSTSGGDMKTGDVQGDVVLKTSGGNIEMGVVGGEANIGTSGGDITVKSVGKSLKAHTSGGNIEIGDVGGEARVSTSGGDVSVRKVTGNATLGTSGGNIHLESASGTVKANTSGGDITLRNISGSIDASTSGGDVDAELRPSGKGRSKLTSSGGEIKLSVPEDAKATIEATIRVQDHWGSRKNKYKVISDFKADSYENDQDEGEIRATYKLNGGGDVIELKTVNSDITLRKLRR